MNRTVRICKNILITASLLTAFFIASLILENIFYIEDHTTTMFVFAVFLVSVLTDGYVCGIAAAFISVLAVNYAFTVPFFAFNFILPGNAISAVIMIVISVVTGALTTKIKRHEAEKMEGERERMRASLLRAVSHDLRTPLTTIYGSASTLIEDREHMTEEQKNNILRGIQEDAEWLVRMVENLLSITKINQGNIELIKTPTVLDELIDSVLTKFHKRYPAQEVQLEMPQEIIVIPMDALLMEQVLINLLDNAVQHAAGMEHLSLIIRNSASCNTVTFDVTDDGCGIDPLRLRTVFTGYFPADDQPADAKKRNSGIGLSVCAAIIKAHGGTISAHNNLSGGATFRFKLNKEEETEDEQQ